MNGHIICGTNIAVDYWKIRGRPGNLIHFLTHLHGDHIVGLTSSWQQPIYCSEFTAELLRSKYDLPMSLLRVCPCNQSIIVPVTASTSFTVTAYDANHCPGAVMFYFQGDFGNIFYTGDFRSSSQVINNCRHLANQIDTLYLDNTFCSPKCVFPSRNESLLSMIQIIKQHPEHDVLIGVRKLGKESLLVELGLALQETICVSPTCYQISQLLFTTNVFTTFALSSGDSRIRTVPLHLISSKFMKNFKKPTIAIIPTAIYTGLEFEPFCRDSTIFVIPYSDHSSFNELLEFVSALRPAKVLPIVRQFRGPFGVNLCDREDMSCFQTVLSKDRPEGCIQNYNTCKNRRFSYPIKSDEQCSQSRILGELSDDIGYSHDITYRSPRGRSVSVHQQFCHRQKLRKCRSRVSHRMKRAARGVVYVNPDNEPDCPGMVANIPGSDSTVTRNSPEKNKSEANKSSLVKENVEPMAPHQVHCLTIDADVIPQLSAQGDMANDETSSGISYVTNKHENQAAGDHVSFLISNDKPCHQSAHGQSGLKSGKSEASNVAAKANVISSEQYVGIDINMMDRYITSEQLADSECTNRGVTFRRSNDIVYSDLMDHDISEQSEDVKAEVKSSYYNTEGDSDYQNSKLAPLAKDNIGIIKRPLDLCTSLRTHRNLFFGTTRNSQRDIGRDLIVSLQKFLSKNKTNVAEVKGFYDNTEGDSGCQKSRLTPVAKDNVGIVGTHCRPPDLCISSGTHRKLFVGKTRNNQTHSGRDLTVSLQKFLSKRKTNV